MTTSDDVDPATSASYTITPEGQVTKPTVSLVEKRGRCRRCDLRRRICHKFDRFSTCGGDDNSGWPSRHRVAPLRLRVLAKSTPPHQQEASPPQTALASPTLVLTFTTGLMQDEGLSSQSPFPVPSTAATSSS